MNELAADLVRIGRFTTVASYQRFGYLCGGLLILSGLFHGVVYLVDGGPWEGPVSWRKPIVFGLSFGITLATLTWFMAFLRPRRWLGWLVVGVFAFASVGEVFLISMQKWRGVASHFNEATSFDGMIFSLMGMLVGLVALVIVAVTIWAFAQLDAPPSLALAIRLGLVLMLASQGVGVQMIVEGGNTFGAEGALKVPHAFTLHAVQVLPALALLLLASPEHTERRRIEILSLGAVGYAALIASTMTQAYAGRSPFDLAALSSALALLGLGLLLVSAGFTLRGIAARTRTPTPEPHVR
ncbi:hypothetical protein [Nocardioides sp.]|uniref:hypothetical protein n=1 Tax=Nocardioides sp. TaxID=35761 RepID=UPI002ED03341